MKKVCQKCSYFYLKKREILSKVSFLASHRYDRHIEPLTLLYVNKMGADQPVYLGSLIGDIQFIQCIIL